MTKTVLTPEQYVELKRFLEFFAANYFPTKNVSPERQPIAVLEVMEKTAPKRAMDGLMMAINDCIEMSADWAVEKVASIDSELKERGIVTLSELRRKYSRKYARIVKRGAIKSIVEYYFLKGVLDGGALEMPPSEREILTRMLEAFDEVIAPD